MDFNTGTSGAGGASRPPGGSSGVVSGGSGNEFNLSDPVGSFVAAVRNVIFGPAAFFRGIARRGDLVSPLVFAIICAVINGVISGVLGFIVALATGNGIGAAIGSLFAALILTPIFTAIGLFVFAAIFHLMVMLFVRPSNSGFEATFRVGAYSSVTQLFGWLSIIPILGVIIALVIGIYGVVLGVIGIREVHSTTTGRAALVVLIPVAVLLIFVALIGLLIGAAIFFGTQQGQF